MTADLHMHTVASDGTDTVQDRIRQAQEYNLDTIAITDHDTINSYLEDRSMYIDDVEVITGAEIKCQVNGVSIEILGYFLESGDPAVHELFETMEDNRESRMVEMISNINNGEDVDIDLEDVREYAEGTVGRPHLGKVLVDRGIATDVNEAFNKYIGERTPNDYYVETKKLDSKKVIETVRKNGGATSLAHPGRDLQKSEADEIVEVLASQGLDGIEVPYTYQHKRQDGYDINFGIQESYKLAEKHNLLITGGSDCHGSSSNKYNIGKIHLDQKYVEKLREVAESRQ